MTVTVLSTKFSYSKAGDTFATEVSELGNTLQGSEDSFFIRSARTGARKLFLYDRMEHDAEGDLVAWHYFSPGNGHRLVIFND